MPLLSKTCTDYMHFLSSDVIPGKQTQFARSGIQYSRDRGKGTILSSRQHPAILDSRFRGNDAIDSSSAHGGIYGGF